MNDRADLLNGMIVIVRAMPWVTGYDRDCVGDDLGR